MRSGNPVLNAGTFRNAEAADDGVMTLSGTINKTGILFALLLATAGYIWWQMSDAVHAADAARLQTLHIVAGVSAVAGFVLALVTAFAKRWVTVTAPAYALAQGFFLGATSLSFEQAYPGIVVQAVGLTFCVFFALLVAYKTGIIKATENFRLGVFAATGGVALFYLISIVLRLFGVGGTWMHDAGPVGILVSLVIVAIAALNLVLDFDFIETGVEDQAPKYMEWYGAFGLMVTLVWLYLEILRLLAKLRSR